MERKTFDLVIRVLFFGACWGIVEATLGLLLHQLRLPTGTVLYPIGLFFMLQCYKGGKEVKSIFLVACVAAAIKSVDLLVVGMSPGVLSPMRAIILEGMLTAVSLPLMLNARLLMRGVGAFIASMGWRVVFFGSNFLLFAGYSMSGDRLLKYSVHGLINTVLIMGIVMIPLLFNPAKMKPSVKFTGLFGVLLLAIVIQVFV